MRHARCLAVQLFAATVSAASVLSAASATAAANSSAAPAAQRPNVILVLADDLGYGDVAANNPDSKIPTPHLDRLAREGLRFTDGHTSSGVCTPTRYSLLTGRYHWRTRLQQGVLGGFSRPLIAENRLTLGGLLQRHGYHTACIGKWHLGMEWPLQEGGIADDQGNFGQPWNEDFRIDYTAPIQRGPVDAGFDHFLGISGSLDMYPYVWIHDRLPTEVATATKAFPRAGPAGPDFEAIDVQPAIIDHTIDYIAQRAASAKQGMPFFAYVPLAAPHTPIVPAVEWQGTSGINPYADFVRQVDADMGRLLETLEEHGLAENTLFIFTSDNGCAPPANFGQLLRAGHNPSYIYRGHKADLYEGGHRVPFVVRWPGKIAAGSVSDQLVGQFDFLATFAELLGVSLPPDAGEDSISFLPVLLGTADAPIRTSLISQSINGSFAIRDGHWKLAMCPGSGGWSAPRPGRRNAAGLPPLQLYDLATDPGETTNLVAQHPARVARMTAALEQAIARGRTTLGPDQPNDAKIVMLKAAPAVRQEQPLRPNIVFILADDLGYGDLSCFGQTHFATPRIDQLATEGMRLTNHYAGCTVCAPSRACLLAGLHTGHVYQRFNGPVEFRPDPADLTVGTLLQGAGYHTALIGKSGLSGNTANGQLPNQKGFHHFFGFTSHAAAHRYYPEWLWRNGARVDYPGNHGTEGSDYSGDLFLADTLAYLEERAAGKQPFFLHLALQQPHADLAVPESWKEPFLGKFAEQPFPGAHYRAEPHPKATFAGMVTYLDHSVGQVIDKLRALGLGENTLVVFSSDNGAMSEGGWHRDYFASSGPLRGGKRDMYEGGIRVPTIAWWPGRVAAGSESDHVSAFWDFLPTACELAGATPPPEVDGLSYAPTLLGHSGQPQHKYLYWEFYEQGGKQAVRAGRWKGVRLRVGADRNGALELYNLESDPGETRNVATEHPKIAAQLASYMAEAHVPSDRVSFGP